MSAVPEFNVQSGEQLLPPHPFTEAERMFILRRPFDSLNRSALRAHAAVKELRDWEPRFNGLLLPATVIEIDTRTSLEDTRADFEHYEIRKSDMVVVVGGDGIASNSNQGAVRSGFEGPIVHIGRGNACDLAHMLFKSRDVRHPLAAILSSRLFNLYPLEITSDKPVAGTSETTVNASAYYSLGEFIYRVTEEVGSREFRAKTENMGELAKLRTETSMMLANMEGSRQITIEDNRGRRQVSDIVFPNGQRMAKKVRFGGLNIIRPGFGKVELKKPTKPSVVWGLGKAAVGALNQYAPQDTYEFRAYTEDESPLVGQRDGELLAYPSGTAFKVRLSEQTLLTATTRN